MSAKRPDSVPSGSSYTEKVLGYDSHGWAQATELVVPAAEGALARGGTVTESRSTLGPELRARIPVTRDGRRELLPTRLLGCDGPGWLLRGLFRGPDALTEVVDPRVHHLLTQTVVDLPPAAADAAPDGTVVEVTMP
ncbi:DUF3710 domain-containing protein [Streptomyces canus]|uniref:DUF3710 domain-containing protein n=1 Tax=Streptomyces canus TaxID=58343 RepID=UPI00369CF9F6